MQKERDRFYRSYIFLCRNHQVVAKCFLKALMVFIWLLFFLMWTYNYKITEEIKQNSNCTHARTHTHTHTHCVFVHSPTAVTDLTLCKRHKSIHQTKTKGHRTGSLGRRHYCPSCISLPSLVLPLVLCWVLSMNDQNSGKDSLLKYWQRKIVTNTTTTITVLYIILLNNSCIF